jgi:hypothetical protein
MPEMINVEEARAYARKRWPSPVVRRPIEALLDDCPRAVEPVRHGEDTSYITTDDMDKYNSRIILNEGEKNHWCRVFYEDDRAHGRWIRLDDTFTRWQCSECGAIESHSGFEYCHCGAKMDLK